MKIDRSSQLLRALEQIGRDPARLDEVLDQVMTQTGATTAGQRAELRAELRAVLAEQDRFGSDQRAALEALLDQRLEKTVAPAGEGARAHVVRAHKHKPWFGAVTDKPKLGPPLFPEPPRDVEVGGQKLGKDELLRMLRGAG